MYNFFSLIFIKESTLIYGLMLPGYKKLPISHDSDKQQNIVKKKVDKDLNRRKKKLQKEFLKYWHVDFWHLYLSRIIIYNDMILLIFISRKNKQIRNKTRIRSIFFFLDGYVNLSKSCVCVCSVAVLVLFGAMRNGIPAGRAQRHICLLENIFFFFFNVVVKLCTVFLYDAYGFHITFIL